MNIFFKIENGILQKIIYPSIVIPPEVTSIGDYAFLGCDWLKEVIISESVTSIGEEAFWHCSNLKSITIPDSVISIGDKAFRYCDNLISIRLPEPNRSKSELERLGLSSKIKIIE